MRLRFWSGIAAVLVVATWFAWGASIVVPTTGGAGGSATNAQPPSSTLSNIANSGFLLPFIALSTNGGTVNNVTSLLARAGITVSNDAAGVASLHVNAGGSGGGTNFTLFNTRQAIITNTLDRLTVTYSANTNIVWDWNATNVVTVSPSNTFTVSQTGTPPSTMLRTGRLRIINTNSTAGYFFGTGPGGSEVTLLTAPSTNDYTISSFNGVVEIVSHQVSEIGTNAYMRTRTGVRRTFIIDASYILTNGLTQGAIPTTYVSPYSSSNAMANSALYFDTDATNATFSLTLPPEYDRNDITLVPVWAATNGSGNVVFQFATTYHENNETFNLAYGSNANSTDALTPTDGYHIGPSVTPTYGNAASTPLGNVSVRIRRSRDHASDTLDAGVFLLRVLLQYTESTTEPTALP